MTDRELLDLLGLSDRNITIGLNDEYAQMMLEKQIDRYLKKVDEERKREERLNLIKQEHEEFKLKNEYINRFNDSFVYGKIKDKLIKDGFVYRCKFCWGMDVSGEYAKRKKPKC